MKMKIGSGNVCRFQFYYTYDTFKYCVLYQKQLLHKYVDLIVKFFEENSKASFFRKDVLSGSNYRCILYYKEVDQNRMAVDGRREFELLWKSLINYT